MQQRKARAAPVDLIFKTFFYYLRMEKDWQSLGMDH